MFKLLVLNVQFEGSGVLVLLCLAKEHLLIGLLRPMRVTVYIQFHSQKLKGEHPYEVKQNEGSIRVFSIKSIIML